MLQANRAFNTKAAASPTAPLNDRALALLTEHAAEWTAFETGPGNNDCSHYARCVEIDQQLEVAKSTTSEGAVASLEYLRAELLEHVLDDLSDNQARLYLGLIDSALAMLRKLS